MSEPCDHGLVDRPGALLPAWQTNAIIVCFYRPWRRWFQQTPMAICYRCNVQITDPTDPVWAKIVVPNWAKAVRTKMGFDSPSPRTGS